MGTVGAAAALGSLVDLDVLDDKVAGVKALGVGVGLGVLQEVDEELGGLLGPAGLADTPLLAWGLSVYPSFSRSMMHKRSWRVVIATS